MTVLMGTESSPLVSPSQKANEVCGGSSIIDKLIDGPMSDMDSWILNRESFCNDFRRPFKFEFFHDTPAADQWVPYSAVFVRSHVT